MSSTAAVVLAGGRGERLGGVDKAALRFGGRTALDRVLDAVDAAQPCVVVGPQRPTERPVLWTVEDPPGEGPVAAVAAGVSLLPAETEVVVVLATDVPLIDAATVERLLTAADGHDGALLVDASGRDQYLLAAYATGPLRAALAPRPRSLRELVSGLDLIRVPDDDGVARDADTWDDVRALEERW